MTGMHFRGTSLRRSSLALASGAMLLTAVTACTSTSDTDSADHLQSLQDTGAITVGFAGEAPYSFEENGQLTGATVALHREIFSRLGIRHGRRGQRRLRLSDPWTAGEPLRRRQCGYVHPSEAM